MWNYFVDRQEHHSASYFKNSGGPTEMCLEMVTPRKRCPRSSLTYLEILDGPTDEWIHIFCLYTVIFACLFLLHLQKEQT